MSQSPAWKPIDTMPKDGERYLLCLPGGMWDSHHVVHWDDESSAWRIYATDKVLTEAEVGACYLLPMWMELPTPPSSLIGGPGIVSESPLRFDRVGKE